MTDYNDGKWHGWNGGECPVDPCSEVEWLWMDPNFNTAGKSNGIASRAAWRNQVLRFRVTKPAPPKPREWWAVGRVMKDTEAKAQAFLDELNAQHSPMDFGKVIHVREVLPE